MQADRSPDMAADLERWTAECEQSKPSEGFNLMVPLVVTVVGAVMFGIVFREWSAFNTSAEQPCGCAFTCAGMRASAQTCTELQTRTCKSWTRTGAV